MNSPEVPLLTKRDNMTRRSSSSQNIYAHTLKRDTAVVALYALQLFIICASNGRPFWTSSGAWAVPISIIIIIIRIGKHSFKPGVHLKGHTTALLLVLFTISNYISAVVNYTDVSITGETLVEATYRGLFPLMIYASFYGMVSNTRSIKTLCYSVSIGSLVTLGRGFLAYVKSVGGIPDLNTIMWARYNTQLMINYQDATFGNVNLIAGYIILVMPILLWLSLTSNVTMRIISIISMFFAVSNMLFCGSRFGIIVLIIELLTLIVSFSKKRLFSILLITAITIALWVYYIATAIINPDFEKRYLAFMNSNAVDNSAEDRINSIREGWANFLDNPFFGIGPGRSAYINSYTLPHESIIHQFAELGAFGGFVFILLCGNIIWNGFNKLRNSHRARLDIFPWLWISGPFFWTIFHIASGIAFTSTLALVWMGISCSMLAISDAAIIECPSFDS